MTNRLSRAACAALMIFGAARANAQITTVIGAPKRATATQQQVARQAEIAQDSIARVTLTGMKEWVDSAAAALALRPDTGRAPISDTAQVAPTPVQTPADSAAPVRQRPADPAPEFRDGMRAPNTATAAPTVAFLGALMILVGVALGRRRESPAKVRVRR